MRAVVCRVDRASVDADGQSAGAIERGLLVLVGVLAGDGPPQVAWMARKLVQLRIFPDDQDRMNRSVADVDGQLLLVPNFTLAATMGKGTRPSFSDAALPAEAERLFEQLLAECGQAVPTERGRFGAHMQIEALFNGPVTILLETP